MYAAHFGLREAPFALTPDPGYLYLGPGHREALAHLLYGISEDGGFVQLTGEVGTGKTTLIRALLAQRPLDVDVALCLNPRLTVDEFVATLCDELGIRTEPGSGLKALVDALNRHLLAAHAHGRNTVVIIDEAQNLSPDVLEQVRLLTNLETHRHKLLRMVLVGQPELQTLLARPALRQLAQRITARCHLRALDRHTARAYLDHRLRVAGGRPELFSRAAGRIIQRHAGGIPRLLNIIGDRALLGAYARDCDRVDAGVARRAAREVLYGDRARPWFGWPVWTGTALLALLIAVGWQHSELSRETPAEQADASSVAPEPPTRPEPVVLPEPPTSTEPASTETPLRLTQGDERHGLRRLLSLWEGDPALADSADPCAEVPASGLRCRNARTDWDGLRRYNRPALLSLSDPRDARVYRILLTALHDESATLMLDDGPRTIGLARLTELWNGEALLLWRPPTRTELLRPGSRGDDVVWLRRQLAEADDRPLDEPVSELFDTELAQRVREFQRRHGLQVDGLAGPDTLLILTSLAPTPNAPRLVTSDLGQV